MKLVFRGHDDRYAVEQSLLAFFPEERPVYQEPEPGEDNWARVDLHQGPVYATAVTEIAHGGRLGRGTSRALLRDVTDEYERERLRQKAVKLSFFKAARSITGLTPAWGALTGIRPGKLAARLLEQGKTPAQVSRILGDTYYVSPSRRRLAVETVTDQIPDYRFEIGKGVLLREGSDVTVVAVGMMVQMALQAAEQLEQEGISVRVIDMHTIKPLDTEILLTAARETGCIVTTEEANVLGGLGSAVAEYLSTTCPVPVIRHGVEDVFGRSGAAQQVLEAYGLTAAGIVDKINEAFAIKNALTEP